MKTLAYINGEMTTERFQELEKQQVSKIIIDIPNDNRDGKQTTESLNYILELLVAGDRLIVINLSNLNRTLTELAIFFKKIQEKQIKLVILNKDDVFSSMTDSDFFNFIIDLHEENKSVIREKTKITTDKKQGRPKLSQEKIERIRWLRLKKKYPLREVAKLCDVSVGTVYKYCDQQEQRIEKGVGSN